MEHKSISQLSEQFRINQAEQFTGKIIVYSSTGQQWAIYFLLGRLIWASGGQHRFRRLFRLISVYAPHLNVQQVLPPAVNVSRLWEYSVLYDLIRQNRIASAPAKRLMDAVILEVLVEILQEATGFKQSNHTMHRLKKLGNPVAVMRPDQCIQTAQNQWNQWRNAGLISYSPNLAPVIKYPDKLQHQVPLAIYQKLSTLLTGDKSLRDLAAHLRTDILPFSRALIPFVNQGIIAFTAIPDWMPPNQKIGTSSSDVSLSSSSYDDRRPLILGVDDSPSTCKMLQKIITEGGYRFIGVHESFRTLPTLFKHKPELIFLDLMMPIANGYEVCSQIRRIEAFQSIPIIILSGKDGMVDRVRAKLVGATDFVSKPFDFKQVMKVTGKYLSLPEREGDRLSQGLPTRNSKPSVAPSPTSSYFSRFQQPITP